MAATGHSWTRELQSARLRDVALGTPFAALPSMRNLAPEVRGGKHERSRRRDPDSEEPQTAGHRSPVRGRWVSDHPDRRSRTEGRRRLYRHAQRAGRLLRGAAMFINRSNELNWMILRLIPCMRRKELVWGDEWTKKWDLLEEMRDGVPDFRLS